MFAFFYILNIQFYFLVLLKEVILKFMKITAIVPKEKLPITLCILRIGCLITYCLNWLKAFVSCNEDSTK